MHYCIYYFFGNWSANLNSNETMLHWRDLVMSRSWNDNDKSSVLFIHRCKVPLIQQQIRYRTYISSKKRDRIRWAVFGDAWTPPGLFTLNYKFQTQETWGKNRLKRKENSQDGINDPKLMKKIAYGELILWWKRISNDKESVSNESILTGQGDVTKAGEFGFAPFTIFNKIFTRGLHLIFSMWGIFKRYSRNFIFR